MLRLIVFAAAAVVLPLSAVAQVLVPEGSEGSVLHIDAVDATTSRISGLDNVHGLSVAPKSGLIIAGSLSERPRDDMVAPVKPDGVSDGDHKAHHGGGADKNMASGAVSIVTVLDLTSHARARAHRSPWDGSSCRSE